MRLEMNLTKSVGLILLIIGAASLIAAIVYASSIPALVGLGLIFWGIIVTYIQTGEYVKKTIFNSTSTALLTTIDEALEALDYKGKAIYLPPKYLNNSESVKAYIPKLEAGTLPPPDVTQRLETQGSQRNAQGMLITPLGTDLTKLLETTLGTSFLRTRLQDLQERLPKVLIEDLEIVSNCEIQTDAVKDTISVKFKSTAYKDICKSAMQLPKLSGNLGCPLSSAFAVAFARASGKPITIKSQSTSEDGEVNETEYAILEEQNP
jgi:hypothetical protein